VINLKKVTLAIMDNNLFTVFMLTCDYYDLERTNMANCCC